MKIRKNLLLGLVVLIAASSFIFTKTGGDGFSANKSLPFWVATRIG